MRPMRNTLMGCAVALGAAAFLCACSSGETPSAPAASARPPAGAPRSQQPAAGLVPPGMVSAAKSSSGGPAPVQVKFELKARPGVAQPLDIDLAIIPASSALDEVSGRVEVGEGLELAAGEQIPTTERPVSGVPIWHAIRVLPKKDGIFTVNAVLTLQSTGQSSSQTFSFPVIVGAGFSEPAKPPAAANAKPSAT